MPEYNPNDVTPLDMETTKESIEFTRNNKGLPAWKIKLKEDLVSAATLARLDILNKIMEDKYARSGL